MELIKTEIDRLEKELLEKWEDEPTRVIIQKRLGELWEQYEQALANAWMQIDPSIFDD